MVFEESGIFRAPHHSLQSVRFRVWFHALNEEENESSSEAQSTASQGSYEEFDDYWLGDVLVGVTTRRKSGDINSVVRIHCRCVWHWQC